MWRRIYASKLLISDIRKFMQNIFMIIEKISVNIFFKTFFETFRDNFGHAFVIKMWCFAWKLLATEEFVKTHKTNSSSRRGLSDCKTELKWTVSGFQVAINSSFDPKIKLAVNPKYEWREELQCLLICFIYAMHFNLPVF